MNSQPYDLEPQRFLKCSRPLARHDSDREVGGDDATCGIDSRYLNSIAHSFANSGGLPLQCGLNDAASHDIDVLKVDCILERNRASQRQWMTRMCDHHQIGRSDKEILVRRRRSAASQHIPISGAAFLNATHNLGAHPFVDANLYPLMFLNKGADVVWQKLRNS